MRLMIETAAFPRKYPSRAPMESCTVILNSTIRKLGSLPDWMMPMNMMVSMYAIGSLLPLSISSNGLRLFLRTTPFDRKIPNTDAESVEETVDASSIAASNPRPSEGSISPDNHQVKRPVNSAVRKTPSMARSTPGAMTGLISENFVSRPPEKRMIHKLSVPIVWAVCMFSKTSPKPSDPKTIPTMRKSNSTGTPKRCPALPTNMLIKNKTEPASNNSSVPIVIL